MSLKTIIKRLLVGRLSAQPFLLRRGLLRGFSFYIDPTSKSQRLLGLDEAEIAPAIRRLAAAARSAVDIGANDGWYSLFFASRPNIERVIAFEPCGNLLAQLRANFALNDPGFTTKLSCIPKLVGNADNDRWCSIDSVVENLPLPVLMKIDVDGGEVGVLRGANRLLESRQAMLVVETHSRELEDECAGLLTSCGFRLAVIPNGWYRRLIPEARPLPQNRWLVAEPAGD